MADGRKNKFSALSGKDKCDETEWQSLEATVAEAAEEALNNENDEKPTVSAKQPTRGKKKTGPPSTTPTGQDGAMIGDIITQVIAAIQPMVIKSVTTAVTAAVATAFKQMREEFQAVETMKGEVKRVNENMARLAAKLHTQHFELDRQEQYSRKDSVRIYGIPDPEDERENTNDIVVKLAKDIGVNITTADLSVSHRLGRRGRGGKPRTIIAKFVRRQCKTDVMRNKKRLRDCQNYKNVYINDDLTTLRNKLVMELKKDDNIKQVWTIEGRIFCIQMDQGREVKRVLDSPEDLFKVGWSEQRVAEMGVYGN